MAANDSLGFWDALAQRPSFGGPTPPGYSAYGDDPLLSFDPSADNTTYFGGVLPSYYGSGDLVVRLYWLSLDDSSPNDVKWDVAFERREPGVYNIDDGPAFSPPVSQTVTATDDYILTETTFTIDAGDAGDPEPNEPFRISIKRDTSVMDNYSSAAYLVCVELVEG